MESPRLSVPILRDPIIVMNQHCDSLAKTATYEWYDCNQSLRRVSSCEAAASSAPPL
jgi:hypothetical protein